MQLDRIASVFVARPLLTIGVVRPGPGIPILMYHSVSDDPEPGISPYYRLATSPARFRQQLSWLRERGYTTIDLPEALRRLETGETSANGRRPVVLTFDDGFRDFANHAWPVLEEFGFSATMFLPTAFIGRTRQSFKGRECLTWSEVRDLKRCGASFGGHTVNHPVLRDLTWAEIRCEIRESRLRIEDELGCATDTFAYPFAFPQEDKPFIDRLGEELRAQGYVAAVTTVIGRARRGADPLRLKRLPVNDADDLPIFATKLEGGYDWLGIPQTIARHARRFVTSTSVASRVERAGGDGSAAGYPDNE